MSEHRAPLVSVVLRAFEAVAPFGTLRQTWLVFHEKRWQSVKSIPGVQLTPLDPGAGTVWESEAELQLPQGTQVQRVTRQPLPEHHTDPMEYLVRGKTRARERVLRHYYTVGARGILHKSKAALPHPKRHSPNKHSATPTTPKTSSRTPK